MLISAAGDVWRKVLSKQYLSYWEVEIEPNVELECVPKCDYLGDTLGVWGGVDEEARAKVRCAWAKFKELSPILTNDEVISLFADEQAAR